MLKRCSLRALIISALMSCVMYPFFADAQTRLSNHLLRFPSLALQLQVYFTTGPFVGEESVMRVQTFKLDSSAPIDLPFEFEVNLFMPSMGHGSAPTQIYRVLDNRQEPIKGVYEVRNMFFIMAGKWDVVFSLFDNQGKKHDQILKIQL